MRYISMFSGIEAASVAWEPLGWKAAGVCEVGAFPSAVLAHRYPKVKNLGDVTKIGEEQIKQLGKIDLAVFGFPCQDLSNAGKRVGLVDTQGNKTRSGLFYDAARLSFWSGARWLVAENVPGLLSSKRGEDFAAVLAELTGLDVNVPGGGWKNFGIVRTDIPGRYSICWRILDAQYVGGCGLHGGRPVPQRRRRVFIVGHTGDWSRPVKVLLDPEGVRRDYKKGRQKKEVVAALTATGVGTCGADDNQAQAGHIIAVGQPTMFDPYNSAVSVESPSLGTNCGMSTGRNILIDSTTPVVAFHLTQDPITGPVSPAIGAGSPAGCSTIGIQVGSSVRRLTPEECEKLQGFKPGWTRIPWRGKKAELCADGPRYKAIGNSMAVPCMSWLGRRIQAVENI